MIRVLVEMWPGGSEERKRVLGEAFITNVGGNTTTGDYEVKLMKSAEYATKPGVWKRGRVDGFPRQRLGPWDLLLRALVATVGGRNGKAASDGE